MGWAELTIDKVRGAESSNHRGNGRLAVVQRIGQLSLVGSCHLGDHDHDTGLGCRDLRAQLVGGVPQPVLDLLLGHCHRSGVSLLVMGVARRPGHNFGHV